MRTTEPKEHISFKDIRRAVSMEMILAFYAIKSLVPVKDDRMNLVGLKCPLGHHNSPVEHKDMSFIVPFRVDLRKDTFQCVDCQSAGDVIDFVKRMDTCNLNDAATRIAVWFEVKKGDKVDKRPGVQIAGTRLSRPARRVRSGIYKDRYGREYIILGAMRDESRRIDLIAYRQIRDTSDTGPERHMVREVDWQTMSLAEFYRDPPSPSPRFEFLRNLF